MNSQSLNLKTRHENFKDLDFKDSLGFWYL